jgi:hypothetical protein
MDTCARELCAKLDLKYNISMKPFGWDNSGPPQCKRVCVSLWHVEGGGVQKCDAE